MTNQPENPAKIENGTPNKEEDWILARQGINLFINNQHQEAETMFMEYPDSLVMYSAYSFVVFMDALMSFEDDKLEKAIQVLKEVEKRCTAQTGWLRRSLKMFSSGSEPITAEQLETQIILADSQVCLAIITFLQQDLAGYIKGSWVLRKAWKVYQRVYNDILTLYKNKIGHLQLPDPGTAPAIPSTTSNAEHEEATAMDSDWDIPGHQCNGYSSHSSIPQSKSLQLFVPPLNNNGEKSEIAYIKKSMSVSASLTTRRKSSLFGFRFHNLSLSNITNSLRDILPGHSYHETVIDKATIKRLMEAVSFGYGLFQLGVSLLPQSLMKLINLLGFSANRQNGIQCLMYARLGQDMRAPLSSLSLLWYHTIVRPFYAVDGVNVGAGVEAATRLIHEAQVEFADSALFLFFAGRNARLKSDMPLALDCYHKAKNNAHQREIKMLCLHEIGWCYLIELNYIKATETFLCLKQFSRWSRSFYLYLSAICIGSIPDYEQYTIFDEFQKTHLPNSKSGQIDDFLIRRLHCTPQTTEAAKMLNPIYYRLFIFEMLYLWNALPSCSHDNIREIIIECEVVTEPNDEPRKGLAKLILGVCHSILYDYEEAADAFRACLEQRKKIASNAEDAHISAYAQYELGLLLTLDPKTAEEGRTLIQQVGHYYQYDFEARLNVRVHSTLKQV